MTTFYADLRVYTALRLSRDEPAAVSVEIPARDIEQALALLMAWKAGLSVSAKYDTAMEESLAAKPTRGRTYLTLREASQHLRNNVFN